MFVSISLIVYILAIFGMDVGGTLTKIVYFQQVRPEESTSTEEAPSTPIPKKNSYENLAQLEDSEHQVALKELYSYMDSATTHGTNKTVIRDDVLSVFSPYLDGKLHFLHFETRNMLTAINLVSSTAFTEHVQSIGCTGGGAHKYADEIFEKLEITVKKYDELGCLVRGLLFALANFQDECYTFRNADDTELNEKGAPVDHDGKEMIIPGTTISMSKKTPSLQDPNPLLVNHDHHHHHGPQDSNSSVDSEPSLSSKKLPDATKRWSKDAKDYSKKVILPVTPKDIFPFLIVNIGSGVSILKISDSGKFERISGTSLGGGTYWGLCRLLTKCQTYEEVLDLAEMGDAGKVDMLVKDIYGGDCKFSFFF
jgi:type II pantothenate kinase